MVWSRRVTEGRVAQRRGGWLGWKIVGHDALLLGLKAGKRKTPTV